MYKFLSFPFLFPFSLISSALINFCQFSSIVIHCYPFHPLLSIFIQLSSILHLLSYICFIDLHTPSSISYTFIDFPPSLSIFQPAREERRLAQRAERSRRDLSALWASWRASAQAVTSKWHFRTTSPTDTNSSAGEN